MKWCVTLSAFGRKFLTFCGELNPFCNSDLSFHHSAPFLSVEIIIQCSFIILILKLTLEAIQQYDKHLVDHLDISSKPNDFFDKENFPCHHWIFWKYHWDQKAKQLQHREQSFHTQYHHTWHSYQNHIHVIDPNCNYLQAT